jgi:TPR repeat protein
MKNVFTIFLAISFLSIASAQSARQLTRRIVPPSNNSSPAGGAAAVKPASPPAAAQPATNSTAVPGPPPPADPEKAKQETVKKTIEFQKKRAAEGSPSAQYELGMRYLTGDGVEKDEAAGTKLLEESAKQDYTLAKKRLDELKAKQKKKPTTSD